MRRIAFFGGSFDPPHRGHLAIARAAADHFALDQILFAPVAHQPLKSNHSATAFVHRYAMTALATQLDPRFVPSLLDAPQSSDAQDRPNYTVDTLTRLRDSLTAEPTTLFTLLGADSWLDIARWDRAPQLLALCDWIVAGRPGFSLESAELALPTQVKVSAGNTQEHSLLLHHIDGTLTRVWFLPSLREDISATELRGSLDAESRARFSDDEAVPAAVEEYIRKAGLYDTIAANG